MRSDTHRCAHGAKTCEHSLAILSCYLVTEAFEHVANKVAVHVLVVKGCPLGRP